MSDDSKTPASPRPNVPEPTIPVCQNCRKPLNQCVCKDNILRK